MASMYVGWMSVFMCSAPRNDLSRVRVARLPGGYSACAGMIETCLRRPLANGENFTVPSTRAHSV